MLDPRISIDVKTGCWNWTGSINTNGYGRMYVKGRKIAAHRIIYIRYKGDIPLNYQIDHLCKNRICVNPNHLEAVTAYTNNRRSDSPSALNALKTHCPQNHPLSGKNLYRLPRKGKFYRDCRTCRNAACRRYERRSIITHE